MFTVGAGGDSLVHIDEGKLRVGPQRDGPPACMGGLQPTPMDTLRVLDEFAIRDKRRAEEALTVIARHLGKNSKELARLVIEALMHTIWEAYHAFIEEVNVHPVYTIQEMLHPDIVKPQQVMVIGAPADILKPYIERNFQMQCIVPEHAGVANALGAALAQTTAQITVLADTQRRKFVCPELDIDEIIPITFTLDDVRLRGMQALWDNSIYLGLVDDVDVDVVEAQCFNMVSGFRTVGRNMRLKLQTRPGILKGRGAL